MATEHEMKIAGKGIKDFQRSHRFLDAGKYVLEFGYVTITIDQETLWNSKADRPYARKRWTFDIYHSDDGLIAGSGQRGYRTKRGAMLAALNWAEGWVSEE